MTPQQSREAPVRFGYGSGVEGREQKNTYHHHPESKKRKASEGNSGSIQPYGRYGNAAKTSKTISTIAIPWPVKAIFEKRAATVEVDTLISPGRVRAVPVFGSGGSSAKGFFSVFQYSLTGRDGSGFGSWKDGSGGSGSTFGFGKNGSDGSGFRFRFGSWATLK